MPTFNYIALDKDGKRRPGRITAPSKEDALVKLREENLNPLTVEPVKEQVNVEDVFARFQGIKPDSLVYFTRQLATMIDSGMPPIRALAALEEVGLAHLAHRFPDEMSGGQQQRVAIARALVGDRRLILADEPTGALDSQTGEAVLKLLRARVDAGAAGVLVTHEARHAAWADRVIFLRDGSIVDTSGPLPEVESLLVARDPA